MAEDTNNGKTEVRFAVVSDEMKIKKHIDNHGKRFVGYVDTGGSIVNDAKPRALLTRSCSGQYLSTSRGSCPWGTS